jgi:hypothetical protein
MTVSPHVFVFFFDKYIQLKYIHHLEQKKLMTVKIRMPLKKNETKYEQKIDYE